MNKAERHQLYLESGQRKRARAMLRERETALAKLRQAIQGSGSVRALERRAGLGHDTAGKLARCSEREPTLETALRLSAVLSKERKS